MASAEKGGNGRILVSTACAYPNIIGWAQFDTLGVTIELRRVVESRQFDELLASIEPNPE
jgi:hypothetical protein